MQKRHLCTVFGYLEQMNPSTEFKDKNFITPSVEKIKYFL